MERRPGHRPDHVHASAARSECARCIGGAAFVTSLFTFVPTAANVGYYLEIVRDKYILRQIISAATESVRRAYEEQDEVSNLLDEVEAKILAVGEDRFKGQMPR